MELLIDSSSASIVARLAAHYLGLVQEKKVVIVQTEQANGIHKGTSDIPALRLQEGTVITQPVVIAKYFISLLRRDIAESLYTSRHQAELDKWFSFAAERNFKCSDANSLHTLNSHLASCTFFCANHITIVDLIIFGSIHQWMASSSTRERVANQNITRWYDNIQHLPGLALTSGFVGIFKVEIGIPFLKIDIEENEPPQVPTQIDEKAKPNQEKKQSNNNHEHHKEKNSKKEKQAKNPKKVDISPERPVEDITRLEIRVGVILKAWNHPEADKLYCEEIDIGESVPRKIASGLRDHISRDQFEGQKVLVLCNMKEKKLKGFPSHGMVLCGGKEGSDGKRLFELVKPPRDAPIGERVSFEGLSGASDPVMNTKTGKDPFVAVQPNFLVDCNGIACYKDKKFTTSEGDCFCDTIRGGDIS